MIIYICFLDRPYPSEAHRYADLYLLLFAGQDSTAYNLSFNILEVARHPEVLHKIQKEIDAVGLHTDQPFSINELSKLVYLDQVLKESMRLWPTAASGTVREANADYHYQDMVIKKGSRISIPFFVIFRQGIEVRYPLVRISEPPLPHTNQAFETW